MATIEAIVSLIDAAKRLRTIADEMGSVELKARILDVLVQLQEVRERIILEGQPPETPPSVETSSDGSSAEISSTGSTLQLLGEFTREAARIEPTGDIETYSFAPEAAETESASGEQTPDKSDAEDAKTKARQGTQPKSNASQNSGGGSAAQESGGGVESELSEQERLALAEQRIADLEPLHQAALKKMNGVLTPEQAARKAAATKKGLAAGLKGKQLQDSVFAVLGLTEEQEQKIAEGRRELHQVRTAIAYQVKDLLSKEQLDRLLRSHRH